MAVAQFVELLLPIPEVRGSNPVIGKNLCIEHLSIYCQLYWKDKNKEKRGRVWPIFKKQLIFVHHKILQMTGFESQISTELQPLPNPSTFYLIVSPILISANNNTVMMLFVM